MFDKGKFQENFLTKGQAYDLELENNVEKDYVAPPKPYDPFGGASRTLGAPSTSAPIPQNPVRSPPPAASAPAKTDFSIPGQPSTKINIPDLNNKFITIIVPLSSTIKELKGFIVQVRRDLAGKRFILSTTFPNHELSNDQATVQEENLKMARLAITF